MTKGPIPPPYLPAPTPILPQNYTFVIGDRSRVRHFLGTVRRFWMTRIPHRQRCCNNAIDRNRLPEPTNLQRWGLLLQRFQLQTPVLVTATSRDSGGSRTWLTQSRVSGDHEPPPLPPFLSLSIPPHHHIHVPLPEVKNGSPQRLPSLCFPCTFSHFLCALPPVPVPAVSCYMACIGYWYSHKWSSCIVAPLCARFFIYLQCVYAARSAV